MAAPGVRRRTTIAPRPDNQESASRARARSDIERRPGRRKGDTRMRVVYCTGPCGLCRVPFPFSPDLVPTRLEGAVDEPLCEACVRGLNELRVAAGEPPIVPLPGAYPRPEAEAEEAEAMVFA